MPASLQEPGDADVRAVDVMVKRAGAIHLVRLTTREEIEALLRLLHEFEDRRSQAEPPAAARDEGPNNQAALDPPVSP